MEIISMSKEKVVQGNSWACAQNRIVAVKDKLKKKQKETQVKRVATQPQAASTHSENQRPHPICF